MLFQAANPDQGLLTPGYDTRSRSCPATSIPPEIFIKIVDFCLPERHDTAHSQEYPMPYNHVCRYWRSVIAGTPHLWANVVLLHDIGRDPTTSEDARAKRQVLDFARIRHQLQHSQHTPITVWIVDYSQDEDDEVVPSAVELLRQHHPRWKEAELDFTHSALLRFTQHNDPWTFSELQRLQFEHEVLESYITLPYPGLFKQAPKLEALELHDTYIGIFDLPWSQLTELTLVRVVGIDLIHLQEEFSQCTSFRKMTLSSLHVTGPPDFTSSITLPALEKLMCIGDSEYPDDSGALLSILRLPSLAFIYFTGEYPSPEDVKKFIKASNPQVATLNFDNVSFAHLSRRQDIVIDLLTLLPSITYLGVTFAQNETHDPEEGHLLEKLLEHLTFSRDAKICPKLGTLFLQNAPISGHSQDHLLLMLRSRPMSFADALSRSDADPMDPTTWPVSLAVDPFHELSISLSEGAVVKETFTAAQLAEINSYKLSGGLIVELIDGPVSGEIVVD